MTTKAAEPVEERPVFAKTWNNCTLKCDGCWRLLEALEDNSENTPATSPPDGYTA